MANIIFNRETIIITCKISKKNKDPLFVRDIND